MENDNSDHLIDKIITIIRQNLTSFNDNFNELSRQLYNFENMYKSHLPEKYILQSLIRENALILKTLRQLNYEDIVNSILDRLERI